jgi:hypothetical protein
MTAEALTLLSLSLLLLTLAAGPILVPAVARVRRSATR